MKPFTSTSVGADWRTSSHEYRREYCELMAEANQKLKLGITGEFIFDSLEAFYKTDSEGVMGTKIIEAVALTVTAYK